MLFANLMPLNVSGIQCSFLISGSEASNGPAKVSPVQPEPAPAKPSNSVPTVLLRLRSTPHELRPLT